MRSRLTDVYSVTLYDVLGSTWKRAKVGWVYSQSFHSENCQERYWIVLLVAKIL